MRGSTNPRNTARYLGQGGQDLINVELFKADGFFKGNVAVWGDWAYGPEDDPYDIEN